MPGIIAGVVVVVIVIWVVATYNGLVKGRILIDEAFATMDVYLKKRFDLIPNLVETVKGYAGHEQETLKQIVGMRNVQYDSMSMDEKIQNGAAISQMIPRIMALAENYPDLKASQNFSDLSASLNAVEEDIANSRKYYNGAVKQYNMKVQMFPGSIIAGIMHFETRKMYEVDSAEERQNVQVKF
ncbi:MAG: LemA family protein [Lachnospiraceae bacterium]|nr:LemA family protein [Lachnospiraceae bacterium]